MSGPETALDGSGGTGIVNAIRMKQAPLLIVAGQIALALMSTSAVPGAPIKFSSGPMTLSFDENTGDLTRVSCRGHEIARMDHDVPPVTFGVGPVDNVVWSEQMGLSRMLIKQTRPSLDRLELIITAGPYELVESYRLYPDAARVDRSVQLVNRGPETVRLRGLAFRTSGVIAAEPGFYRFPATWPPRSHRFAEMQPGRKAYGRGTIAPALAELSPSQSLLWASFTEDSPGIEVTEDRGRFEVRQTMAACGYLRPNVAQDFGFVSLQVVDGDYWKALGRLWAWMDSVELRVPPDRPDWVPGGILYSFHPGGTIGSGFKDLGGFPSATEKLLPTLPRLGVNAIWILPVESQSPYWPYDYYRFAEGLGDAAQYRQLVAKARARLPSPTRNTISRFVTLYAGTGIAWTRGPS